MLGFWHLLLALQRTALGKRRKISVATFRDRIVRHALCTVIEPRFGQVSSRKDSYANRVGKSIHRAIGRLQRFSRKYRYVLCCDIHQLLHRLIILFFWEPYRFAFAVIRS